MKNFYLFIFIILSSTEALWSKETMKVVHIGDSQSVGAYGPELNRLMRTIPNSEVSTFAAGGSGPEHWLTGKSTGYSYYEHRHGQKALRKDKSATPLLTDLMKRDEEKFSSQLVIVQQGGNLIGRSNEYIEEWVKKLVIKIKESKSYCVWVGPSNRREGADKMTDFYKLLEKTLKGSDCHLIDSRKYTSYPKILGDGRHFNFPGGKKITDNWARKSFDEIKLHLSVEALKTKPAEIKICQ